MKLQHTYTEEQRKRKEHDRKYLKRKFQHHIARARHYGHLLGVAEGDPYKDPWVELEATIFKIDCEHASLARLFEIKFNSNVTIR